MNRASRIGFFAWIAQAILQVVWHAWLLLPARAPIAVALVIALAPLALPLVYWRRRQRALLLAGIVNLFYFCHGVAEAWSSPAERTLALVEVILALVLIGALGASARHKRVAT